MLGLKTKQKKKKLILNHANIVLPIFMPTFTCIGNQRNGYWAMINETDFIHVKDREMVQEFVSIPGCLFLSLRSCCFCTKL